MCVAPCRVGTCCGQLRASSPATRRAASPELNRDGNAKGRANKPAPAHALARNRTKAAGASFTAGKMRSKSGRRLTSTTLRDMMKKKMSSGHIRIMAMAVAATRVATTKEDKLDRTDKEAVMAVRRWGVCEYERVDGLQVYLLTMVAMVFVCCVDPLHRSFTATRSTKSWPCAGVAE